MNRGTGSFTLFLVMSYKGWPHVSFYPAEGGEGFGGNHFGTGDSVLRQWKDAYGDPRSSQRLWDTLGLRVLEVPGNDARLRDFKYAGGLEILEVRRTSLAEQSGFRKNDVVVGVDRWRTLQANDVLWILDHRIIEDSRPQSLRLRIIRNRTTMYNDLTLEPQRS